MRSSIQSFFLLAAVAAIALPVATQAKDKKAKAAPKDPQDAIEVVGHIPAASGTITRFLTTQHYSSSYLYAEHPSGMTMIDVTKADHPSVLAEVPASSGNLSVVAGTAALVTSEPAASTTSTTPATQTVRIMDFSDPQHPKVTREFAGVTATSRDDHRGLIFLANGEGIWILRQHLAEDPAVERAYAYQVLYGPSMFAH